VSTNPSTQSRWGTIKGVLEAVSSLAVVVVAAVFVYQWLATPRAPAPPERRPLAVPSEPLSLVGAALIGQPTAPVALLEFSDFECPYCGRFATEVLPVLKEKFISSGRLLFAFRHMPLSNHANARNAAIAAGCAAADGKFEQYHDLLFANPKSMKPDDLRQYAVAVGISEKRYADCVEANTPQVTRDVEIAKSLGVRGTPAFFVGQIRDRGQTLQVQTVIQGIKSIDEFVGAVQAVIGSADK
jgi:protein-disulfide isomerase